MPHLEKGKRHFCKGVKKGECIICGDLVEVPSNKKVVVCYKYSCHVEAEHRRVKRSNNKQKNNRVSRAVIGE